ncbi:hypothetical protein [Lacinutrix sp. MedPE-SW]|uniref:hypothetical protein n=1 Tax=Lacinutrix sp. MedPE-SW TaxID=1860087 RepID=UPI00091C9491|nr:hypothetical protein [Lacinutrix sp. MedPE-SW]OIQ15635.1 MAG: hypothetical protein BM549_13840 [Lacinutrix sp. MedPE-SW]
MEQKTVKQKLSLSGKEYKSIKNDNEIISGLNLLINDSVDIKKIDKALNEYFNEHYKRKHLIRAIEFYSVFGNSATITDTKIDSTHKGILEIRNKEELEAFKNDFFKEIKLTVKKKDSL